MVIWIIGKSGSGKSLLAKKIFREIKFRKNNVFWIDGDRFRKKFSQDLGHSINDRKKNSRRIQNYCKKKEQKNDVVVCSILSIFTSHQKKNRKIFNNYFQIYIKAKKEILQKRNDKKIYNITKNVVGKDIKFPKPYKSDMTIINKFDRSFFLNIKKIIKKINARL